MEEETEPLNGLYELPLSLHAVPETRSGGATIEVGHGEIRLDGEQVLALEADRVAADAVDEDGVIGALRDALRAASAPRANLSVAATVPYRTTAQVLRTLQEVGIDEASFAVRPAGEPRPTARWLPIERFQVVPADAEAIRFRSPARPWSDFAETWRQSYQACQGGSVIACDAHPARLAEGGELAISLFTQGDAMRITYRRVAPEQLEGQPDAEGRAVYRGPAPAEEAFRPFGRTAEDPEDDAEPEPATQAVFTVRQGDAAREGSSLTGIAEPVCGTTRCAAVVEVNAVTPTMRVVSLIGAAFPRSAPLPELAFRLPRPMLP